MDVKCGDLGGPFYETSASNPLIRKNFIHTTSLRNGSVCGGGGGACLVGELDLGYLPAAVALTDPVACTDSEICDDGQRSGKNAE
jgi:hypothetical protein